MRETASSSGSNKAATSIPLPGPLGFLRKRTSLPSYCLHEICSSSRKMKYYRHKIQFYNCFGIIIYRLFIFSGKCQIRKSATIARHEVFYYWIGTIAWKCQILNFILLKVFLEAKVWFFQTGRKKKTWKLNKNLKDKIALEKLKSYFFR